MGKILRPLAILAAVAVNVIPGAGQAISAAIFGGVVSAGAALAITAGITLVGVASAATMGGGRAGVSLTPFDPKSINPDPASPRKLVFGQTTFPVDLRYAEPSGTNQEFIDYIFALAAHKSDAITEIYIEDDLAWTVGGGAQGKYAGYLTVEVILEAGSGAFHTVNAGATWGSSRRMTGCTTMKVRVKRSDNSKSSQSPFSSGINGRWAVIGRGIPVYDPALDSTVAGGSGSQRAATQTTWAYTAGTARGNNPALQLLTYLLGWRIGGVVSVGCGLPVDALDLPSFATAAALCDESVALAAGGSQRRYEAGRAFADSDDPMAVIRTLLDAMNGELVDDGGRLSLRLAVNDLTPSFTLTDDDFVSGYSWKPAAPIEQQYTVVRGRYSAPGATLYGLVDYPEVAIPRTSLAPRPLTLELSAVQEPRRAERIAKQAAVRNLYQGTFTVTLGVRGWLLRRNMVVAVTSSARGWTAKLFRVRSLGFNEDATVDVVLREENAAIYAWSASESAQVTPVAPIVFDSRAAASWLMAGIEPQANLTAPNAANRVPFSRMEGNSGWAGGNNTPGAPFNPVYFTFDGRPSFGSTATATAAGQIVEISTSPANTGVFPLTGSERLSVQARVGTVGASSGWQINLGYNRANGTYAEVFVASGPFRGFSSAPVTAFVDVPADAVRGNLKFYGTSSGTGNHEIVISEPMVASAAAGQTVHPTFTPGPNAANGATVGAIAGTNLLDSGGRALTDSDISNTSQRVAVRQWAFNNQSLNGWAGVAQIGSAPTVTAGSQFVTYTANSTDTSWMSPDLLGVDGRVGRYLRMILSATATLSAGMRNVEVFFSTNAYAPIDGTRAKNGDWIPANHPADGTPFEVLLDMHTLTAGGNAWRDEIIRQVRIDFDPLAGAIPETIRIHEISMVYLGTADVTAAQPIVSRLSDTTGQALGNFVSNQGNPFAQLVASGEARDGDVITFPTTLSAPPRIFFLPGGKAVAADNIRIEASGLSTSGFTMIAKSQTVTVGSTITDGSSTAGGTGEPDRIINRTNSGAPFDGRFTYRFSVTVGNVAPGEPGFAEVALFARKGGNWTEVGREIYSVTGTYNRSVTPGTVDFGTGSEFGVSLVYGEGTGTALTGFTHVQYVLGTVTEASLTPSNASPIPWQAFL